jgi:uncharacterized protein (TIGR03435 family)
VNTSKDHGHVEKQWCNGEAAGLPGIAADPGGDGAASIFDSPEKMGLKLDARKAAVEQVVVLHIEKMPTEN